MLPALLISPFVGVIEDRLNRKTVMVASLKSISFMLGPVWGAILYTNLGITIIFTVNGILFLLSAISETMIR